MAHLSCSSCGLSVLRQPDDTIDSSCPRCGRPAPVLPAIARDRPLLDIACELDMDLDRAVVRPRGELDLMSAEELEEQLERLMAARMRYLVLDLGELTFIDSSGIRLLLTFDRRASNAGVDFELVKGSDGVQRVFALAGVLDSLTFREHCPSGTLG